MLFLTIMIILLAAFSSWMIWKCMQLSGKVRQLEERTRELPRLKAIRQNLERMCEGRGAEIRRLRGCLAEQNATVRELEEKASSLNVSLFNESGLRILAEKEEGARRMKMAQLEKELSEARKQLRERETQAQNSELMYQTIIKEKDAEIVRLQAAHARRAKVKAKAATGGLDQISLDDILTMNKETGGKHRGK